MRKIKKIMALVIAAVMIVGTMSMTAFAATGDLSVNGNLKIEGLDAGDVVTYYQILKWDPDNSINGDDGKPIGWVWGDDIKTTGSTLTNDDLKAITGTTDDSGQISAALAGKIAENVTGGTATAATAGDTWTQTVTKAGLYMAIVDPASVNTLYNPIFVAANYVGGGEDADDNNEISITANALTYSDTAMAKKTTLSVDKESTGTDTGNNLTGTTNTSYTADVDEPINFTVKTHVPKFGTNYTDPVFKVTDTLNGIALTGDNVKVYKATAGVKDDPAVELVKDKDYTITGSAADSTTYTITFTEDYLWGNPNATAGVTTIPAAGQDIVIEYTAKITDEAEQIVNPEDNTVDVIFSTTPDDTTGKGLLRDQTNHYTFSIDADLLGHSEGDGSSTEAIKVGVDKEGNYIVESKTYAWSNEKHGPLAGAKFALFTTSDAATEYTGNGSDIATMTDAQKDDKGIYHNSQFSGIVETDANGRINIKGLDASTYYLKELTAPDGFIKMQDVVTVTITADITEEYEVKQEVNNAGETVKVTYKTNKLNGYSVAFSDGKSSASTNYTITLSESSAKAIQADRVAPSSDFELKNTKGVELPSTGGMGTTLFYIIGAVLVLGAGILLVTRRRMSAN